MRLTLSVLPVAALAITLLRGLGELIVLQRWRLRTWLLRRSG